MSNMEKRKEYTSKDLEEKIKTKSFIFHFGVLEDSLSAQLQKQGVNDFSVSEIEYFQKKIDYLSQLFLEKKISRDFFEDIGESVFAEIKLQALIKDASK
jgi:hypothetical protein